MRYLFGDGTKAFLLFLLAPAGGTDNWAIALLGWACMLGALYFLYRALAKPDQRKLRSAFEATVSKLDGVAHSDFVKRGSIWLGRPPEASGLAIDRDLKNLVLARGDEVKQYAIDDVREYELKLVRPGSTQVYGASLGAVAASFQAGGHNAGRAMRALLDSGLFLRVRDVEHPVWQIHMLKEPMLNRWAEILSQAFERQEPSTVEPRVTQDGS